MWGPKAPPGEPQYRRREKEKSNWGGSKADDISSVVGIWLPADGWQIYAQTIRRRSPTKEDKGRNPAYMVVEVWRLWPTTFGAEKFQMWSDH